MATKNQEDLDEYTVEELREMASRESVDVPSHSVKADIIKAIQKQRKQGGEAGRHTSNPETPGNPRARQAAGQPEPEAIKNQRERFEATNFGPEPLPADDPRRAPRPENVDHVEEGERLEQLDRDFHIHQGDKDRIAPGDKVVRQETVKH